MATNLKNSGYDTLPVFKQGIAIVQKNGRFGAVMVGGKEIVPPIYDGLSEFIDGYAVAKWVDEERRMNLSSQIEVKNGERSLFLPAKYDWGYDFVDDLCIVIKDNKYGVIDTFFNEVIPCKFEYIEPLSNNRFLFSEGENWGIIDNLMNIIVSPEYNDILHETENCFRVGMVVKNGSCSEKHYGLLNEYGNTIIPIKCKKIVKMLVVDDILWLITNHHHKQGVYNEKGSSIIPVIYDNIELVESEFVCSIYRSPNSFSYGDRIIDLSIIYNTQGEQILKMSDKYIHKIPSEYDIAYNAGLGFIRVMKNGKWGMIDRLNNVVVEPQFSFIDVYDGSFAIVGNSEEDVTDYFLNGKYFYGKQGLVDTSGKVVLPVEYDYIEKWDNNFYLLIKDEVSIVLSPCLEIIIELDNVAIEKFDNRFIVTRPIDSYLCGLIDFYGNEIIPMDKSNGFEQIEVIENDFLKVVYHRSETGGCSSVGILDGRGKVIYKNVRCDDISYIGNGLLLVRSYVYTNRCGNYRVYNLANFRGEEIFATYYKELELEHDGYILICGNKGWGAADPTGKIIIMPKYIEKIKFENGYSDIAVVGCQERRKITQNGHVVVYNFNEEEILIPTDYYWGTNFVKGISIVRSKEKDYIGSINENGEIILDAKYDMICLFSNDTFLVNKRSLYGLYDLKGECVLPSVFTSINYVKEDRILLTWNLGNMTEDSQYFQSFHKNAEYDCNNFEMNYRSAICNLKGEILNASQIVYVGRFTNKYACSYGEIKEENHRVVLKLVGVIDIDGNTIIPPEYDYIALFNHSFASIRKGHQLGIANLETKSVKMFDDISIKYRWKPDKFGRFVYSDNGHYDSNKGKWVGEKGVASFQGLIVPSGKYQEVELLENGLIKVGNSDGLYGLLNMEGKEIVPLRYSYISNFIGEIATICLGGKTNFYNKIIDGKWGIINIKGEFIKECIYDNEESIGEDVNVTNDNNMLLPSFEKPIVILFDKKPTDDGGHNYDYAYVYDNDYDNGSSKYGGYNGYDDDTIDSAFDGNPELTWNID